MFQIYSLNVKTIKKFLVQNFNKQIHERDHEIIMLNKKINLLERKNDEIKNKLNKLEDNHIEKEVLEEEEEVV